MVLVIGYSLPEYDHHAIDLLYEMNRDSTLCIVDKYAAQIASRYSRYPNHNKFFQSMGAKEFCEGLFSGKSLRSGFIAM